MRVVVLELNRKGWVVGDEVGVIIRVRYRFWVLFKREGIF